MQAVKTQLNVTVISELQMALFGRFSYDHTLLAFVEFVAERWLRDRRTQPLSSVDGILPVGSHSDRGGAPKVAQT